MLDGVTTADGKSVSVSESSHAGGLLAHDARLRYIDREQGLVNKGKFLRGEIDADLPTSATVAPLIADCHRFADQCLTAKGPGYAVAFKQFVGSMALLADALPGDETCAAIDQLWQNGGGDFNCTLKAAVTAVGGIAARRSSTGGGVAEGDLRRLVEAAMAGPEGTQVAFLVQEVQLRRAPAGIDEAERRLLGITMIPMLRTGFDEFPYLLDYVDQEPCECILQGGGVWAGRVVDLLAALEIHAIGRQ